jgi:hypothetical protein
MARKVVGPTGSRRRRWLLLFSLVVTLGAGMIFIPSALAVQDVGFQLDGDVYGGTNGQCNQPDLTGPAFCVGLVNPGTDWAAGPGPNGGTGLFANDPTGNIRTGLGLTDAAGTLGTPGGYPLSLPANFSDSTFVKDFVTGSTMDLSTYATGSKDIQAIDGGGLDQGGNWQCTGSNNVGNKVDIYDAYAALYTVPSSYPNSKEVGDNVIFAGLERGSPNGTADAGFWFLKGNSVGCKGALGSNTNWTGQHVSGDLLVVVEYTGGGVVTTVNVYQWQGGVHGCISNLNDPSTPGTPAFTSKSQCNEMPIVASTNDCKTAAGGATVCATANGDPVACGGNGACKLNFPVSTPWDTPTPLNTPQFLEMGIDLTKYHLDVGCYSKVLADTRSSATPTATLFDYALGSFNTCTSETKTKATKTTSGDGFTDTATITGKSTFSGAPAPTGSVKFYWCGPGVTTCDSKTGTLYDTETISSTNTDNPVNVTSTAFTPSNGSGEYCFHAVYSGDNNYPGSEDDGTNECFGAPSLVTTANPTGDVTLQAGQTVTLKDSALLSGGLSPTGTITFKLYYGTSTTAIDTETATVTGNGSYSTPTGYTLPTDGTTVTGAYHWTADYNGDASNTKASDPGTAAQENINVKPANPKLVTTANPNGDVTLTAGATVTLKDSALLSDGYYPTGTITFNLYYGTTLVDTETANVTGNGSYSTAAGYTLKTDGTTVTGAYHWTASYSGDGNNNTASDPGTAAQENINVKPANPKLVTTANPNGDVTLTAGATVTLKDSAVLSDGYYPTGTITFNLYYGTTLVDTETANVTGNGSYSTAAGYTLKTDGTTVTGAYHWTASYSGDGNNNTASDPGTAAQENINVKPANPKLVTTANPNGTITLDNSGATITLKDSAVLSGGYYPTGTITFKLHYGGNVVDTETATVTGNGTYSTAAGYTIPSTGTVTGDYYWTADYGGDGNNNTASDDGSSAQEKLTIKPASPQISTTPNPASGTVGVTLNDSATLSAGYRPTGTITFQLFGPSDSTCSGTPAFTNTVNVNGNGTYSTSAGFASNAVGTWHWIASYSGDGNNNPIAGTCTQEPVTITGGQGCTPGFWKNHTDAWDQTSDPVVKALFAAITQAQTDFPSYGFSDNTSLGGTSQLFGTIFGLSGTNLRGISSTATLLDAINTGGGGFAALERHGTAGLLSSLSVAYPYSAEQVLVGVHDAFAANNPDVSDQFFKDVLADLTAANNLDESACPA